MKTAPKTATELNLMQGSPPRPEHRVDCSNWQMGDAIRWSFKNLPQLIPCAEAHRGRGPVSLLPTADPPFDPLQLTYTNHDGRRLTIEEMVNLTYTDALLVLHHGRIIHESYYDMHDYQRHLLQSVSKSLTACLLAVLADQGMIDVQQTVAHYLPEFKTSAYGDATIQQVLDMSASVKYDENYEDLEAEVTLHTIAGGWFGHVDRTGVYADVPESLYDYLPRLQEKSDYRHGELFRYISANTDVLAILIERVGQRPFTALFQEHIWQYLGAEENAAMTVDPHGGSFACGGFNVTLRDLGRVGLMALGNGWYNGRQIVPASFFHDTRHNGDNKAWQKGDGDLKLMPNGSYRNQFWVTGNEHGAFFGVGIHGQYIYVDPTADLVITKFSSHPTPYLLERSQTTLAGFDAVAQALRSNV